MHWDARSWLEEWDALKSASSGSKERHGEVISSILPLVAAVMESSASTPQHGPVLPAETPPLPSCHRTKQKTSAVVNLLHLVQHTKVTTGQEVCPAASGTSACGSHTCEAELPVTPTSSGDLASLRNENGSSRRILVVFRDSSLSGPDALHLVVNGVSNSMPGLEPRPSPLPSAFHTSSRMLLQTHLASRVQWWATADKLDGTSSSPDHNPMGSLVVRTAVSKSGVLEAWYVPQIQWLRHGAERGFAWIKGNAFSSSVTNDDVVAVSFDSSGTQIKSAVCRQRLTAIFHTSILLALAGDKSAQVSLVVDVGERVQQNDNWGLLQQCAVDAAGDVSLLLPSQCHIEVHPHVRPANADVARRKPASTLATQQGPLPPGSPEKPVVPPRGPTAVAPIIPEKPLVPPRGLTVESPAATDNDDTPLWQLYRPSGESEVVRGDQHPSKRVAPRRLLCSSSAASAPAQQAAANSPATAAEVSDGTSTFRTGPFASGPTEVLFLEIPLHLPSAHFAKLFGASSVLRQTFVRWFQPLLAPFLLCCQKAASGATGSAPMSVGPLRTVVFLCHDDTIVSEILMSFADAAHDDNAYVPFLLAVGDPSRGMPLASRNALLNEDSQLYGLSQQQQEGEGVEAPTIRLQRMVQYLDDRLPSISWERSVFFATSQALKTMLQKSPKMQRARVVGVPPSSSGGEGVKQGDIFAPLLAVVGELTYGVRSEGTDAAHDRFNSVASDQIDRVRRKVAQSAAPMFGRVLQQLFTKPRRPEVAVDLDHENQMFVGVVRPPSNFAAVRAGSGHHTMSPGSVRVTADERTTVLDAIRTVFSLEYRSAVDVLMMHRQRERRLNNRKTIPYLAGYCPLFVGARRVRLSTVVRRNLFTEVELNLQDVQQQLRGLVDAFHELDRSDGATMTRGRDSETATVMLENIALHLFPQVKCNCTPRIGEQATRILHGTRRSLKLCRHVVQVVCHFLDTYASTDGTPPLQKALPQKAASVDCNKRRRIMLAASSTNEQHKQSDPDGCETSRRIKSHRSEQEGDRKTPDKDFNEDVSIAEAALQRQHAPIDFMEALRYVPGA